MLSQREKIVIRIIAIAVIVGFIVYGVNTTKLRIGVRGGYTCCVESHEMKENEVLTGKESFHKDGFFPIYISEIKVITTDELAPGMEAYVFYGERQDFQFPYQPITRNEIEECFGANMVNLDDIHWMKDDSFDVVLLAETNRLEKTWIKVTYRVLGIFKKEAISAEIGCKGVEESDPVPEEDM